MHPQTWLNEWDNFGRGTVTASRFEMEQFAGCVGVPMVGSAALEICESRLLAGSRGSSVSIVSGYGLDGTIEVRSPADSKRFFL
jgi:hypothetical protein